MKYWRDGNVDTNEARHNLLFEDNGYIVCIDAPSRLYGHRCLIPPEHSVDLESLPSSVCDCWSAELVLARLTVVKDSVFSDRAYCHRSEIQPL
jgi:hypothetical protein